MKLLDVVFEAVVDIGEQRKLMTQDEFVSKARAVHDAKRIEQGRKPYTYDNINLVNRYTKVSITCPVHGDFPQTPNNHLQGNEGCRKCDFITRKSNTDKFIQKAHAVHDAKRIEQGKEPYTYENVNYVSGKKSVLITCPVHGDFPQRPNSHLMGGGCQKCSGNEKSNTDEFIQKAKNVHDEKRVINGKEPYDYTEVKYVNNQTNVIIICNEKYANDEKHGPFLQLPTNHLRGNGCQICNELKGETNIKLILSKNNIEFIPQYQYEDCTSFKKSSKNKICKLLSFDFYLPKFNKLIEFDGFYHFNKNPKSDNDKFMSDVLNDREKNNYTKLKDIKLIRISYFDIKNLEEEIRNGLLSKNQLYLSKGYGKHKTGWVDDNFQPTTKFTKKYT